MQKKPDRASWLKGGEAACEPLPARVPHAHRFVLLGAPGVGKGTQAELLSDRLGACHLSTGDIFRAARTLQDRERTPAMTGAIESMRCGKLVSDETVISLVAERVRCLKCSGGFLLDGFPRTVAQAEALEGVLAENQIELEAVLNYNLPLDTIVNRLGGRRTCSACKAVFHVETRPPKQPGVCDHCHGALWRREDDQPESIRVRMAAYENSTAPLINYYRRKSLLLNIPAKGTPEEIFARTLQALGAMQAARA